MNILEMGLKIAPEKMKLSEQEEFELLSNCSLMDIEKKGLTGKRLAVLIYIFAKRVDASVTLDQCLDLDMDQAASLMVVADPKG